MRETSGASAEDQQAAEGKAASMAVSAGGGAAQEAAQKAAEKAKAAGADAEAAHTSDIKDRG